MGDSQCYTEAPQGILRQTDPVNGNINDIKIQEVLNGFIVRIGCQTVVFETKEKMLLELARYLANRAEVEKEYLNKRSK